jgi:hypothetical protein
MIEKRSRRHFHFSLSQPSVDPLAGLKASCEPPAASGREKESVTDDSQPSAVSFLSLVFQNMKSGGTP